MMNRGKTEHLSFVDAAMLANALIERAHAVWAPEKQRQLLIEHDTRVCYDHIAHRQSFQLHTPTTRSFGQGPNKDQMTMWTFTADKTGYSVVALYP